MRSLWCEQRCHQVVARSASFDLLDAWPSTHRADEPSLLTPWQSPRAAGRALPPSRVSALTYAPTQGHRRDGQVLRPRRRPPRVSTCRPRVAYQQTHGWLCLGPAAITTISMSQPESLLASNETRVDPASPVALPQVDRLLSRLVASERASVSLIEALAPPVTFDQLFAFYRESGFLYPGKLAALDDRRDRGRAHVAPILLGADRSVFRFISRLALAEGRPSLLNADLRVRLRPRDVAGPASGQPASAGVHRDAGPASGAVGVGPRCWNRVRAVLIPTQQPGNQRACSEASRSGCQASSRRSRSSTTGSTICAISTCPAGAIRPWRSVRSAPDEGDLAATFYEQVLDPVELASLCLAQPGLHELDARLRDPRTHAAPHRTRRARRRPRRRRLHRQPQLRGNQLLVSRERDRVPARRARPASADASGDVAVIGAGRRG